MQDTTTLAKYYETLSDSQLMELRREGGFTEQAEQVFAQELKRRNLGAAEFKKNEHIMERAKLREEAQEKGFRGRGPGLLLFGRGYLNEADKEANIQVRTKFFSLGRIPLVPIASFQIKCNRGQKTFSNLEKHVIERVPIVWPQVFLIWLQAAGIILAIGLLIAGILWLTGHHL